MMENTPSPEPEADQSWSSKKHLWLRLVLGVGIIAAALIIFRFTPVGTWLRPENLRLKEQLGVFAPLWYIVIYFVATVLAVPGTILTLSAGALFGPFLGTVWTVIGATLGATCAFLVARFIAGDWAKRQFEKGISVSEGQRKALAPPKEARLRQLSQGIEQEGFWFALSIRLVPIFPFNAVNYLLGLTPISLSAYVLATAIGIIPGSFAYAWLGCGGLEAATGGPPWQLLGALAVLAVLSALPVVLKWLKRNPTDA